MDDYGIDDIRANLRYLKKNSKHKKYSIDGEDVLSNNIDEAIAAVDEENLENELKEAVIDLWEEIQDKFKTERKPKRRF